MKINDKNNIDNGCWYLLSANYESGSGDYFSHIILFNLQ